MTAEEARKLIQPGVTLVATRDLSITGASEYDELEAGEMIVVTAVGRRDSTGFCGQVHKKNGRILYEFDQEDGRCAWSLSYFATLVADGVLWVFPPSTAKEESVSDKIKKIVDEVLK